MMELSSSPGPQNNSPIIIEFVGLAGTGKTTIVKALNNKQSDFLISPDLSLRKFEHFLIFVRDIPSLLPFIFRSVRNSRWPTWDEIKAVVYLDRGQQIIAEQSTKDNAAILLDHGPIFKFATLQAFGPESLQGQEFNSWWRKMYLRWASILDIVVWLDAPIPVLQDRINSRQQKHTVKHSSEKDVFQFLERYRISYENTLNELRIDGGPKILRFDTNQVSIAEIVDELQKKSSLRNSLLSHQVQVETS